MSILSEAYRSNARVRFQVTEHTGGASALDADFHFAKVQLDDGSEVEGVFDARPPEVGQTGEARVGLSVFKQGDGSRTSYGGKRLHALGTSGGMLTFVDVVPER